MMTIFLILFCCLLTNPVSSQLDHFTYTGFRHSNKNLSFTNDAEFLNKDGIIRLTSFKQRITGQAFHSTPFRFKNSENGTVFSFSTCFALCIVPSLRIHRSADGLTFAIAPSREFNSSTWGGYLGLLNSSNNGNFSNHVFAVEFDTYKNKKFNDRNDNHVGVDINSLISNQSASPRYINTDWGTGVDLNLNLLSGLPILAWIDYDSVTSILNVTLSSNSTKPLEPLLSVPVDLSRILFENMYIGFTASTGWWASSHYILGWSFSMNGTATSLDLNSLPSLHGLRRKQRKLVVITVSSTISIFISLCILLAIYWVKIRRSNAEHKLTLEMNISKGGMTSSNEESFESWELEIGPNKYKYSELKQATKNFSDTEVIGKGGFGRVYRGTVSADTKTNVAVKRILNESKQGFREFLSEVSTIGKLRHRNLVQLLGWCRHGADLLLVYDLMPNGSLDKLLFTQSKCILSWPQRFNIIKGVASGMWYLHEGYEKVVIHRDVKSGNVLLDGEMNAKVGDFGLAKLHDHGSNLGTTRVVGTFGYMAPEFMKTGRATTSSDVFAFGTLLLEVVCGRRPIESTARLEDLALVDLVRRKHTEERILDVVDEKLKGNFNEHEVLMVLKLGLMCSSQEPSARPSMRQVMSYLEGEVELPAVLRPHEASGYKGVPEAHRSASFSTLPDSVVRSMYEPR